MLICMTVAPGMQLLTCRWAELNAAAVLSCPVHITPAAYLLDWVFSTHQEEPHRADLEGFRQKLMPAAAAACHCKLASTEGTPPDPYLGSRHYCGLTISGPQLYCNASVQRDEATASSALRDISPCPMEQAPQSLH